MLQPSRSGRSRYIFALLVATAVTLLTLDFRGFGPIETIQRSAREVAEPVAAAVAGAFRPVGNLWRGITDYGDVKSENERLKDEVAKLRSAQVGEANARQMLDTILAQQDILTAAGVDTQLARVVSGPISNFENTIRLDKGSADGIKPNMPVVTDAGLVGRVKEVTRTRSVVELADSRGFAVGVRLVGGTAQTTFVARGQGPGQPLLIEEAVDPTTGIEDGSALVTSGLEQSIFPADILVGRVTGTGRGSATADRTESTLPGGQLAPLDSVGVQLFVDVSELSFVTVLLWEPEP